MITDAVYNIGELEFLISRVIGLRRGDAVNEMYQIKIYLVSDATFTVEFDSKRQRDEECDALSRAWRDYVYQNSPIAIQRILTKLYSVEAAIDDMVSSTDHVGEKQKLGVCKSLINETELFINEDIISQ